MLGIPMLLSYMLNQKRAYLGKGVGYNPDIPLQSLCKEHHHSWVLDWCTFASWF